MKLSPLTALAVVAGLLLTAAPAHAVPVRACAGDAGVTYNSCLTTDKISATQVRVLAGQDVYMTTDRCERILELPGFRATLYADDPGLDRVLTRLTPSWHACGPDGLAFEFFDVLSPALLNEDDGEDEVYALIAFFDPEAGEWPTWKTGVVRQRY